MAIEYVGGTTATGASSDYAVSLTSLSGGIASSPSEGDIVIVNTGAASDGVDIDVGVTTSGYTEIYELYEQDNTNSNSAVCWKIMGSSPDTSVTCKGSGSADNGATTAVHVWRNINQDNPIDVTTTTATGANGSQPNSPSITPITAGSVVLSAGHTGGAADRGFSAAPTGYSNTLYIATDPSRCSTSVLASKFWSGSGAEDPGTWTYSTTSGVDSWTAGTIVLRPAGIDLQAPTLSITATLNAPTLAFENPLSVSAPTLGITATLNAPTLTYIDPISITPPTLEMTLTMLAPSKIKVGYWNNESKNPTSFTNNTKSSTSWENVDKN